MQNIGDLACFFFSKNSEYFGCINLLNEKNHEKSRAFILSLHNFDIELIVNGALVTLHQHECSNHNIRQDHLFQNRFSCGLSTNPLNMNVPITKIHRRITCLSSGIGLQYTIYHPQAPIPMSLSIVSTEQHIKCKLADTSHCNFEKNLLVSNMNMSGFLQTTGHASWLQKFHNASQTEKCFYNIFFYNFFPK